jgi:hypothetical protein
VKLLYRDPQIFYKMFSSARFWVLNLHNQLLSEVPMMSIGMDRQLVLPILFSRSYPIQDRGQDALCHFGSLPFLACFIAGFPAFQKDFKEKGTSRACGECGKVSPLLGWIFPSGGGDSRFLRIFMDAVFSIRPFITSFLPTDCAEEPAKISNGS